MIGSNGDLSRTAARGLRRPDGEDPIAVLSAVDNTDKHRLLHHGFVYPAAQLGVDLIQVRNRRKVISEQNVWVGGQPITHGTVMARFRIRGPAEVYCASTQPPSSK